MSAQESREHAHAVEAHEGEVGVGAEGLDAAVVLDGQRREEPGDRLRSAGRPVQRPGAVAAARELARVAQMAGRDVIYTGWASARAKDPTSVAIAYREMLTIDIVDGLVPFAASDRSPIILVSTHASLIKQYQLSA